MHRPRLAVFGHDTGSKLLYMSSRSSFEKVVRRFCYSFSWSSSSFYLSCRRKPWSWRSWKQWDHFPYSSLSKLEQFFFCLLLCSMHAWWKRRVSVAVGRRSEILLMFTSISFCLAFLGQGQLSLWGVAPVPEDWYFVNRSDLVVSFLISMLRLVHSDSMFIHINTLHTLRTQTHCERALSCLATRKVKTETEVKKVECLLLYLGRHAVMEQAVNDQLLWLFNKVCKKGTECARTVRALELDLSLDFRPPNSTSYQLPKRRLGATLFLSKENGDFLFPYLSGTLWRIEKAKRHPFWSSWFMPSRPPTIISKKPQSSSLFWSWQWSDSSGSATDGSFDIGLGKTLRIGDFPSLDQSAHVYLHWHPGPFLATQYNKEPGGAGFEARFSPFRISLRQDPPWFEFFGRFWLFCTMV